MENSCQRQFSEYVSIHYQDIKEINYLMDTRQRNKGKKGQVQNFNSDQQGVDSIAQKLYKKIVRQGFIEQSKKFAILQTRKKVETMYDLSDKWIDDEEAFTESEVEKNTTQFSQYKAISGVSIEQFYKKTSFEKVKQTNAKSKTTTISELFKNPLTVVKFDQLKKKIQSNIRLDSKQRASMFQIRKK